MSEEKFNDENLDNTNSIASIVETGDTEEVRMILGSRDKIRHAGVIRPGIKSPVSSCTQQQKDLYKKMLDAGHGFAEIDAEMLKLEAKGSTRRSCLRPSNCDHFVVRDEDFKRPADAAYIREHYADADGRVRKIPVWISVSDLQQVLPHNFRAFDGGGNVRCVSFYDGDTMKFRYIDKGVRAPKPSDWKILDTDDEDEATKACGYQVQFGGMLRFYVPGLKTAGEVILPSRSWNGLSEAIAVLKRTRSILGRFDGLFRGETFLEIVKVQEEVKHEGKKSKQWLATLQLAVDPIELARYAEPQQVAARSLTALRTLTGSGPSTYPVPPADHSYQTDPGAPAEAGETHPEPATESEPDPAVAKAIQYITEMAAHYELNMDHIRLHAARVSGGVALEDLSVEDLRSLAADLQKRAKADDSKLALELQGEFDDQSAAATGAS